MRKNGLILVSLVIGLSLTPAAGFAQDAAEGPAAAPVVDTGGVYYLGDDIPVVVTTAAASVNYTLEWVRVDRESAVAEKYPGVGAVRDVAGLGRVAFLPTQRLTKKGVYFLSGDGIARQRVLLVDPLPQVNDPAAWPFGLITSRDRLELGAAMAEEFYRVGLRWFHFDYPISSINSIGASADPNAGRISAGYESFINRAAQLGLNPIFKLMSHYSQIQAPTDLNGAFYAGLRKIQSYYAGKLRYWTIGNEVEGGGYSVFSADQYAAVIKNMSLALKGVDPAVKIIAGEFYSGNGNQHLTALVSPAYRSYWDILSGHNMVRLRNGNAPVSEYLANLGGLSRPIWDTEANGTIFGGPSEWTGYMYSRFPTSPDADMHSSVAKHMARTFCLETRSGNRWLPAYYNPAEPCLGVDGFIAMHYNANWETLWALRRHWISDTQQPSELNHKVANFRAATDMLYGTEPLTRIPNTDLADPYNAPAESTYSGADGYTYRSGPEYLLILWRNTGAEGQDRELALTTDPADAIRWCDSFGNCYPLRNEAGTVKVWVRPEVVYVRGFSRLPHFARETTGNDAPYFLTAPVTQATAGQRYNYTALAYDSDAPAAGDSSLPRITYSLVSAPAGLTITDGGLAWTPSTPGAYAVTIRATSQHGATKSVDQTFTLNVAAAGGSAPQFLSAPGSLAAPLGVVWRYNANAWDPDGGLLTYALAQAPAGMTLDPSSGFIQWTPAGLGSFPVTVTASDGAATATQTFTLRVGAGPIPVTGPSLTVQPAAARQGEAFTFTLQVPGSGQALTIRDALPAQLQYVSAATTCPGAAPAYSAATRTVTYTGTPASGQTCALTIVASVATAARETVVNAVTIDDGTPETVQVSVMLNPLTAFLPVINR